MKFLCEVRHLFLCDHTDFSIHAKANLKNYHMIMWLILTNQLRALSQWLLAR